MTAELLRRAACLMRERAEAATAGPWTAKDPWACVVAPADTPVAKHSPRNDAREIEAYGGLLIGESIIKADREHIASWHPAVALAVADWLEDTALGIESAFAPSLYEQSRPNVQCALAVARAYLGEEAQQ